MDTHNDLDALAAAYANGTLQSDSAQVLSDLDTLFSNYFTPAFMNTFNAYKAALTKGLSAYIMLGFRYIDMKSTIANLNKIDKAIDDFEDWFSRIYQDGYRVSGIWHYGDNGLDKTGNLAAHTAFWLDVDREAKKIWDMIEEYANPTPTPPKKWWQKLPNWVQWILRSICFGWFWMNWF